MSRRDTEPVAVRSYFSYGRGLLSPEDICARAKSDGHSSVGILDLNSLSALTRLRRSARQEGLKPLTGARLKTSSADVLVWVLRRPGLERLNDLLSRVIQNTDHDLAEDLSASGWTGLRLALDDHRVLEQLLASSWGRGRQGQDLRVSLAWKSVWGPHLQWARAKGVKVLAVNEAVWTQEKDRGFYRVLRSIDTRVALDYLAPSESLEDGQFWPPPEDLEQAFRSVPEALTERGLLAEEAAGSELEETGVVFPGFQGMAESEAASLLRSLCDKGIQDRYPQPSPELSREIAKRLEYEMEIIEAKGFSSYFLTVHDIVRRFPHTCGRGSAAASIVSFLLKVTHVDPLRYHLFFERFLNWGRHDPPDIDVDFPWDERAEVLRYVFETYPGRSAMVADHVTFSDRSPWRETALAHGLGEAEIKELIQFNERGQREKIPSYISETALRLKGMPRFLGTHPGGVIITPGAIHCWVPTQVSPLGWPVIAWEKDGAEEAGLVKIDLLGNRSLAVLRDCIRGVNPLRKAAGKGEIVWEKFQPYNDRPTIHMMEGGDTLGVFYIESPATRLLLRKMGHADFEDLVAASSIIRPAANRYASLFVERLRGKSWEALDPDMEALLVESKGIMIYQEDVSRVAMAVAGFEAAEADGLRRILSKKDRARKLTDIRERFISGGVERGKALAVLESIWEMMLSFQGYSFTKPHSASYALVSMKTAWMKHNYPLHFYTAVVNNGGGFYTTQVYVNAIKRLGYKIFPMDVNRSQAACTVENGGMRLGLGLLADWPSSVCERLLKDRGRSGPFSDYADFLSRLTPSLAELRPLIRSGALDSLAGVHNRPQLFWMFFSAQKEGLFPEYLPVPPKQIKAYSREVLLRDELHYTGLITSVYPLELFRERARRLTLRARLPPLVVSKVLSSMKGSLVSVAGMFVTQKPVLAKGSQSMAFVSLEDAEGTIELVVFPEAWARLRDTFAQGSAYLVCGRVCVEWGAVTLELEHAVCLNRPESMGNVRTWAYWGMAEAI